MTTLHIVSSGGVYGVENMLLNLLPELAAQGAPAALLCLDGPRSPLVLAALARGVRADGVDCARPITPLGWLSLLRYIAKHRPVRVHLHGYKAIILAGFFSLCLRRCVIVTYHGLAASLVGIAPSLKKYVVAENYVLRRAARVVAVSAEIRTELVERGVPVDRIPVIFNGVAGGAESTPPGFLRGGTRSPQLLAVGRLAEEKNFSLLIEVVSILRTTIPGIHLAIAGDGPLRSALRDLIVKLGAEDAVELLGFVQDVRPLLLSTDCFVMPSKTEGMPMALLEAMASGCPIVASSVGGIPSMVRDECEALLVRPGDRAALARAISRLLSADSEARRLGAAARLRFEHEFTAEAMARAYSAVYREACG